MLAAIWLRDLRLVIGWLAFFPFWLFNFFSVFDANANLEAYRTFPLILDDDLAGRTGIACATTSSQSLGYCPGGCASVGDPVMGKWRPTLGCAKRPRRPEVAVGIAPETERAELYRAFESRLVTIISGWRVRVWECWHFIHTALRAWDKSQLRPGLEDEAPNASTVFFGSTATAISQLHKNGWNMGSSSSSIASSERD